MKKSILSLSLIAFAALAFVSFKNADAFKAGTYVAVEEEAGEMNPLWADYKSWYQITKGNPNTGDPTGFLDGKHKGTKAYREIYINKVGEAVHKQSGNPKYPEGTVIVKESYGNKGRWEAQKSPQLTIMVKLKPGESPETGDWGWVMGGKGKISTGTSKRAKFCSKCHIYGAANDYTFMTSDFIKNNP